MAVAPIDLSTIAAGTGGFVINGQTTDDYSGISVASAGDINGDGFADLIIGAYRAVPTLSLSLAGKSYVVFGKSGGFGASIDLSTIAAGTGGFVINGQSAGDSSGTSVASAGDINGDGIDDLIIGANRADPTGRTDAGKSYVVFGKTGGFAASINLSAVAAGTGGFVLNGQIASDNSGISVASAGDVNGDGVDDLIVGAHRADPTGRTDAGKSYVVFGKTGSFGASINLSAVAAGTGGFVINGQCANDRSGISVASAGDVNGDGFDDLIVGAVYADPPSVSNAGRSYVVFGTGGGFGASVELSAIAAGTGGFVINGQCASDQSGNSVASAGDVNGDGIDDLIVGARHADPAAGTSAGKSYVVFGKTSGFGSGINLSAVAAGTGGFVLNGQIAADQSGISVASAGDVNGDGLNDLIVGAHYADPVSGTTAGKSYVVFGKTGGFGASIELADIEAGTGGFVINGQSAYDRSGISVASAGDVDGDGFDDLTEEAACRSVTYYHIELDEHDILLAEGLPAESYLDTGNRGMFENAGLPLTLYPDLSGQAGREALSCAPFASSPEFVKPVWDRLAARAAEVGMVAVERHMTTDPDLRIEAAGRVLRPIETDGDRHVFVLPAGCGTVRLLSRASVPADIAPWNEDRRRLGLSVRRISVLDGAVRTDVPLDHPGLCSGWWGGRAARSGDRALDGW